MKHAILLTILALGLSACGPAARTAPQAQAQAVAPAQIDDAANQASSSTPSEQDMALANQIAQVPIEDEHSLDEAQNADASAAPSGDYFGQPLAEREAQQHLPQAHDGLWRTLVTTRIHEDVEHGLYTATHSDAVRALVGQSVTLSGFVMPLETSEHFRHFILTRYTPVCPFCPPGAPNEVVEVWSNQPITATNDLVRVSGQFSLTNNGEKGLFFQLRDARLQTQSASLDARRS